MSQPISKHYTYWAPNGRAEAGTAALNGSLSLWPHGLYKGTEMQICFQREMPFDQQIAIADRVLATVQRWRDSIVEHAERTRTAEDELSAAKRRIAELEAAAEDGAR